MVSRVIPLVLAFVVAVQGDIISYECTSFPEDEGWERDATLFPADRWLDGGRFFQYAEVVDPGPPEEAEQDSYRRSLAEFVGAGTLFVEWHMETDGPQEGIEAVAPAALAAGGRMGIHYHFTIADDQVRFLRDPSVPIVWVDIEAGVPHTYRLELYGLELYVWCIDGEVVDSGVPEGPYPTSDSFIVFGAKAAGRPTKSNQLQLN